MQYRMHPSTSAFPNSRFYGNQTVDAPNAKVRNEAKCFLSWPMFGPCSFINVDGREEASDDGHDYRNMVEVAVIMTILQKLFRACHGSLKPLSVCVASPYPSQVMTIHEKAGCKFQNSGNFTVGVKFFDGFHGGEEDIMIISTVRSSFHDKGGWISNPQGINDAFTRARCCLWIIGNENALSRCATLWKSLISDSENRDCYFNAFEDKDLEKVIIDVKKELDELEDLLNEDSKWFKNTRWQVLFSDSFRKSFGKLKKQTKKLVIALLLRLSIGWRPKRNSKVYHGNASEMLKQFKVENFYILCSNDIVKFTQVLRVWDILDLKDIPQMAERLSRIFEMYTDDYLSRCKLKSLERKLEVPMTWVASTDIVKYKDHKGTRTEIGSENFDGRSYAESSEVNDSLLLMKFYCLSVGTVSYLLSEYDENKMDLPFEMTDQELEVIHSNQSSFILGRSGTGKTTVLTMKLFQNEQFHHIATQGFYAVEGHSNHDADSSDDVPECSEVPEEAVLRQIFVTVSSKLCFAVRNHIYRLKSFARGGEFGGCNSNDLGGLDDTEEFSDIPDSFIGLSPNSYPLVITFQKFLMMLDGTVGISYFERFPREIKISTGRGRSVSLQAFIKSREVNYEKFCTSYWPRFNTHLTRELDPSTVFTEILSRIKGGVEALDAKDGKLGREEYLQLSHRRGSILGQCKMEMIYEISSEYEKRKKLNYEFDVSDIVNDLHVRLKHEKYEGDLMDFVNIDEVQDLSMSQIALFKYISRNVDSGYMFSGDTAQAITRGVSFRFEDIRYLFFKEFLSKPTSANANSRLEKGKISDLFHLSHNFRTHAGVLNLAQSVIDLLCHFFPSSFDFMDPEMSLLYGELPVLLHSGNENAISKIFGGSNMAVNSIVGFGAEQVVLVRDDIVKRNVCKIVGKQALVLTILESKGLEFQDVLLYNFFDSPPLENQWNVIYQFMKEQKLLDATSRRHCLNFDEEKHMMLCSELKLLYVAITRTRQRLWICEGTNETFQPVFEYWERMSLVQFKKLDDSLARQMQVASSKDEWRSRGLKLFYDHNYETAILCFERAGDRFMERWAKANALRSKSYALWNSNTEAARKSLKKAADIFDDIDKSVIAAQCYYELEFYEKAGKIYMLKCGESKLDKAAECFVKADNHKLAAELYSRGNFFSECLAVCDNARLFDMGLQFINDWRQNTLTAGGVINKNQEVIEREFLKSAAFHHSKLHDRAEMMKFVKAFHSIDCMRPFLKNLGCLDELLSLEEEFGNFLEAAKVANLKRDLMSEARLLEKAECYKESSLVILWYLFFNSPCICMKKCPPLESSQQFELSEKAMEHSRKHSDHLYDFVSTGSKMLLCIEDREAPCITGLKFIKIWKKYTGSEDYVIREWCELHEIERRLLEECALHYHHKDRKSMMEYVKSFHSPKEMRDFLNRFNYPDELLQLEVDHGNFNEAAKIAKQKGDMLLEADFKEKAGLGEEASLIILWFLFMNSPCIPRNKWVPQRNILRDGLSEKAKALAKVHSDIFYEFVCGQANLLLSKRALEKPFNAGLQFVQHWIKNNLSIDYAVKAGYRVYELEQDLMERCARLSYDQKDMEGMMNYVKSFHSLPKMRSFLKKMHCLDELLLLEKELQDFPAAADVAMLKGDIVCEADLWSEGGYYEKASMIYLLHVYSSSLWISENKNWPPKQFARKDELLQLAKSCAWNVSEEFYQLVCTEASILSNAHQSLRDIGADFEASKKHKSSGGEILSARKILDFHLSCIPSAYRWVDQLSADDPASHSELMLAHNEVSIETLAYFWNSWKDRLLEISSPSEQLSVNEFCLKYFGVRIQSSKVLLYSDADWVRNIFAKKKWRIGNVKATDRASFFASFPSVARGFCLFDILSVGLEVLSTLKKLHHYSVMNSLSLFYQSMPLIHMFEVSTFLMKNTLQFQNIHQSSMLQGFLDLAKQKYFRNVFPADWRKSLSIKMIWLRCMERSRNLLEELIVSHINSYANSSRNALEDGRVMITLLGSDVLTDKIFELISKCLKRNQMGLVLIELVKKMRLPPPSKSIKACKYSEALEAAFNINCKRGVDSISLGCFLYLVERLLFLASFSEGCFFTSESSFVEWLVHQDLLKLPSPNPTVDFPSFLESVFSMIHQLLYNEHYTREWIKKSPGDPNAYPLLVLRMVVILCMLALKSDGYVHILRGLLRNNDIASILPESFTDALRGFDTNLKVDLLAEAFKRIGNRVVFVSFVKKFPMSVPSNVVFVDMASNRKKDSILSMLLQAHE